MNTAELKIDLIAKIIKINDVSILIKISELLNDLNKSSFEVNEVATNYVKTENIRIFNEWEQAKIDKAIKQFDDGECISDEEAQKEIQACLED